MSPEARTTAGRVRGVEKDGVLRYLGVPYAAPPVRFAAPEPVPRWDGARDATAPGPNAPQPPMHFGALDMSRVLGHGWRPGEDYLTVDVWTPGGTGLPVMVFLHGGGFVGGEPGAPVCDGTVLARAGIVLVSVTYRVGIEGFLPLPGGATNIGLRDQFAALAWVRENAAAFGGDPDLVTVFGQLAGAMCIGSLLGSPLAAGLFDRAIVQSGGAELVRSLPPLQRRQAAHQLGATTLHDRAVEQTRGERGAEQRPDAHGARQLAEHGHQVRVTAERSRVLPHPGQRGELVAQPDVRRPSRQRQEPLDADPVGHRHQHDARAGEHRTVADRSAGLAPDEATAVQEHHHREPGTTRRPHVDGQIVLAGTPAVPEDPGHVEGTKVHRWLRRVRSWRCGIAGTVPSRYGLGCGEAHRRRRVGHPEVAQYPVFLHAPHPARSGPCLRAHGFPPVSAGLSAGSTGSSSLDEECTVLRVDSAIRVWTKPRTVGPSSPSSWLVSTSCSRCPGAMRREFGTMGMR